MSRILHYDCFAGISGDMNLAALIDLGVPVEYLTENLALLGIGHEFELQVRKSSKNGIHGTEVRVSTHDDHGHHHHHHHGHDHRSFANIREMIVSSGLSDFVKERSVSVFACLAEAEAKVHGVEVDKVHFHEVGAVDSIVDIVASCIAIEYLAIDKMTSSAVELGSGTVKCQHGVMPVPAPATALLSEKFPASIGGTDHEATTPTGAAYLAALVDEFEPRIKGRCIGVGVGIGHRDSEKLPNILRVSLYETGDSYQEIFSVPCRITEANIDDMTPEHVSYLIDKLFEAGAMDAWQESICMKKNRMGVKVCALASVEQSEEMRNVFFKHSSTLGVRELPISKYELPRESSMKATSLGEINVKTAKMQDGCLKRKPEFDDCRKLADGHKMTIRDVTDTIQREI